MKFEKFTGGDADENIGGRSQSRIRLPRNYNYLPKS
jgi:hypothetical protein